MTTQELNRDIKRLLRQSQDLIKISDLNEYERQLRALQPEFLRLYRADMDFSAMSKASVLAMLRINLRWQFISLHHFGLKIDLENL